MILQKMFSPNCGKAQMWDQTLWLSRKWTMCTNWHCQEGKAGLFEEGLIYLWISPDVFVWKFYWCDGLMVQQQLLKYVPIVSKTAIQLFLHILFVVLFKVHIFWEGHKILQNSTNYLTGRRQYIEKIIGGDVARSYALLRIYELLKT